MLMPFTLPTDDEKHTYVHAQFERIARRYDLTNDVISFGMHRIWKAKAVDIMMQPAEGAGEPRKFLDVCCGTGDLAIEIAKRVNLIDQVTGLDFSSNMLKVAEARTKTAHQKKIINWVQGDAQNLPFEDNEFDGAIISFGLRNLVDIKKGLSEMARVVKSKKHVVNLDLGSPQGFIFAPAFNTFFRYVVPVIGSVLQNDRDAYTYLPESKKNYPDPDEITGYFEAAGMENVQHKPLAGGSVALHYGRVL